MPYATYRFNKIIAAETIRFIVTVAIVVYKGLKLVVYRMLTQRQEPWSKGNEPYARQHQAQTIKHYQRISDREAFVTAEIVHTAYQGIGGEYETLLKAFDRDNGTEYHTRQTKREQHPTVPQTS